MEEWNGAPTQSASHSRIPPFLLGFLINGRYLMPKENQRYNERDRKEKNKDYRKQ